jgi:hypothetical protein
MEKYQILVSFIDKISISKKIMKIITLSHVYIHIKQKNLTPEKQIKLIHFLRSLQNFLEGLLFSITKTPY